MKKNDGKDFERDLHAAFTKLHHSLPFHWERVVDSFEAGNIVRRPDCDFKFMLPSEFDYGQPFVHWVECKSSVNFKSLTNGFRSLIKGHQTGKMRIGERAGACTWYWFRDENTKQVELWNGPVVHKAWVAEERLSNYKPALVIPCIEITKDPQTFIEDLYITFERGMISNGLW